MDSCSLLNPRLRSLWTQVFIQVRPLVVLSCRYGYLFSCAFSGKNRVLCFTFSWKAVSLVLIKIKVTLPLAYFEYISFII